MPEERKYQILLVDDDSAVLLSLKAILEISGFEVDIASSAAQARSRLQASQYHMVITDMKMEEDRAGFQVIKGARESGYDPAIAILTAYPVENTKWKDEGAHCLLVKPIPTDVLLRKIEGLLEQHEERKRQSGSS
jgi:DNA-binding response OmpR family regulator